MAWLPWNRDEDRLRDEVMLQAQELKFPIHIHTGITGYAYVASQCLSCHPTGQPATFTQHDALYFPIYSGSHAGTWSACTACHPTAGSPSAACR